jgi:hypothetical protein
VLENSLYAPEASAGKNCGLLAFRPGKRFVDYRAG